MTTKVTPNEDPMGVWPAVEKAINSIPFALAYRIDFKDGGESEIQVIQRGLSGETAAEELAKLVPAVAYNGNRPVKGAFLVWGPEENFGCLRPEPPHASDCAIWAKETCNCVTGKRALAQFRTMRSVRLVQTSPRQRYEKPPSFSTVS